MVQNSGKRRLPSWYKIWWHFFYFNHLGIFVAVSFLTGIFKRVYVLSQIFEFIAYVLGERWLRDLLDITSIVYLKTSAACLIDRGRIMSEECSFDRGRIQQISIWFRRTFVFLSVVCPTWWGMCSYQWVTPNFRLVSVLYPTSLGSSWFVTNFVRLGRSAVVCSGFQFVWWLSERVDSINVLTAKVTVSDFGLLLQRCRFEIIRRTTESFASIKRKMTERWLHGEVSSCFLRSSINVPPVLNIMLWN